MWRAGPKERFGHFVRWDSQVRSTAIDSRSILVGVLRFESGSQHLYSWGIAIAIETGQ